MINRLEEILRSEGIASLKAMCYSYARKQSYCSILDSCNIDDSGEFEFLAAFGCKHKIEELKEIEASSGKWLFGVLSYELKNQFEQIESNNKSVLECPDLLFFEPELIIGIYSNERLTVCE